MNETLQRSSVPWTILLVDDEREVRNTLRKLLARSFPHATFLEASNGREGLSALRRRPIDLIITDQRMPEMDGLTFVKEARLVSPGSARVILTGFADVDLVQRAINEGHIDAFYQKPPPGFAFTRVVAMLLEAHRAINHTQAAFARAATLVRQAGGTPFVGPFLGDGTS